VKSKTIHNDVELLKSLDIEIPAKKKKNTRFDINYFFIEIKPLSKSRIAVQAFTNVDPKISFIPKALMDYFMKQVLIITYHSLLLLQVVKRIVTKIFTLANHIQGTEYEARMKSGEHKSFYESINERLKQFDLV